MHEEGFASDDDEEWLGFNDLFSPAPLVPPGAETFEFSAPGRVLRLTQSISSFTRRDGEAAGAADTGVDRARNTSALIWDASVVLASWFAQHHAALLPVGASCVELGAGMGLAGLTAAACGYPTTLTDRAEALPPLRRAVECNGLQTCARVAELPWGCREAARNVQAQAQQQSQPQPQQGEARGERGADAAALPAVGCLLLADVVYDAHLISPLLASVRHLSDRDTCILLAYDVAIHRHAVYAAFERACADDFEWHELDAAAPPPLGSAGGHRPSRGEEPAQTPPSRELKASVRVVRLVRRSVVG